MRRYEYRTRKDNEPWGPFYELCNNIYKNSVLAKQAIQLSHEFYHNS